MGGSETCERDELPIVSFSSLLSVESLGAFSIPSLFAILYPMGSPLSIDSSAAMGIGAGFSCGTLRVEWHAAFCAMGESLATAGITLEVNPVAMGSVIGEFAYAIVNASMRFCTSWAKAL
jgi:hypothetical protein